MKWLKWIRWTLRGFAAAFTLALLLNLAWAVTFSPNKGYSIPTPGADSNTWGSLLNTTLAIIDTNLGGEATIPVGGNSNVTMTVSQAQNFALYFTGTLTGNIQVLFPNSHGFYYVSNGTTGNFSLTLNTVSGGVSWAVAQGGSGIVFVDGTNVLTFPKGVDSELHNLVVDAAFAVSGLSTLASLTVTGNATVQGASTTNGTWNVVGHGFTGAGWTFNAQGVTAAGSTQGTATALATTVNFVAGATGASGPGVRLVYAEPGDYEVVVNQTGNTGVLPVYPQTGASVYYQGTTGGLNGPMPLNQNTTMACYAQGPTQWYCN